MSDWFIGFRNIFPIGGLISLWSRGFTIIQSRISKQLLSNSKLCQFKVIFLKNLILNRYRLVLNFLV